MRRKHMLAVPFLIAVLAGSAVGVTAQDEAAPDDSCADGGLATTASAAEQSTTPPSATSAEIDPFFAATIESAGLVSEPSVEEAVLAGDAGPFQYPPNSGPVQVSAADNFVELRTCRPSPYIGHLPSTCGTDWAYLTGSVDGGEVRRGLLGTADRPEIYMLDDRFFVAINISRQAPTAWLIDSVSGGSGELTWRDEPTTVSSRAQALVIFDDPPTGSAVNTMWAEEPFETFLPQVVDARDGTIRPLAVPDDASANLPVTQNGQDRIWVGTVPSGHALDDEELDVVQVLGLAFSDDGGTTWTEVTLPAQLFAAERREAKDSWGASIAADGDSIAVTTAWSYADDRYVYISSDAGRSWSTVTIANPSMNNGAFLYVLADKRLLLVKSDDPYAAHLFVSTDSDWTELDEDLQASRATRNKDFTVNRAGTFYTHETDANTGHPSGTAFSTDLANWRTIAVPDD